MASYLESEAMFRERAVAIGVSTDALDRAGEQHIKTMGALAFAGGAQPGQQSEAAVNELVKGLLNLGAGVEPSAGQVAPWRRLIFEASALAIQEVKSRIESPLDHGRGVPNAERAERYHAQVKKYPGIKISGPMEPSHALLDLVQSMVDSNLVEHISLEKATSREQEMAGSKKVPAFTLVNGSLVLDDKKSDVSFNVGAAKELDVYWAYHRRALAFDQCDVITYQCQANYIQRLFTETRKVVAPGFHQVTLHQVIESDKTLWRHIAEDVRGSIKKSMTGERPLETAFKEAQSSSAVEFCLLPRQAAGHSTKRANSRSRTPPRKPRRSRSRSPPKKKEVKKDKKVKIDKKKEKRMGPGALNKYKAFHSSGRPFCFGFNDKGCSESVSGDRCKRGMHICMSCNESGHGAGSCSKRQ